MEWPSYDECDQPVHLSAAASASSVAFSTSPALPHRADQDQRQVQENRTQKAADEARGSPTERGEEAQAGEPPGERGEGAQAGKGGDKEGLEEVVGERRREAEGERRRQEQEKEEEARERGKEGGAGAQE